jgi:hypothetical protein
VNCGVAGLEENLPASAQTGVDQILHYFVLAVDSDRASAREFVHVDPMPASVEAQFDSVMHQAFAPHTVADARFVEQIHRTLLQNPRADSRFHVLARLSLDYDGVDALEVEQMGEDQARRSGPDDADLRMKFPLGRHRFALDCFPLGPVYANISL